MPDYRFQLINGNASSPISDDLRRQLLDRPGLQPHRPSGSEVPETRNSLAQTASLYRPDEALETAINTAIAIGEPLLLTGEPGTGKTQAAYYVAHALGLGDPFHFQTKSTSAGNDLLYDFDTVQYFHDAQLAKFDDAAARRMLNRDYVKKGTLWRAFDRATATGFPTVVLIDEIDKAPRDFPNDLLHEIDQMQFHVQEIPDHPPVTCARELRPLVFITSNDERRLPPAFLRRCVTHHIELTKSLLQTAVESHRHRFRALDDTFLRTAVDCFWRIRDKKGLEKRPATGELLAWLQVLSVATGNNHLALAVESAHLPYLGTIIKTPEDLEVIKRK